MTQAPLANSSPSSAILTSTPPTAGPTVSIRILPGRFAEIRGLASVCPYPCRMLMPSPRKKNPMSGLRAAPPDTKNFKRPPSLARTLLRTSLSSTLSWIVSIKDSFSPFALFAPISVALKKSFSLNPPLALTPRVMRSCSTSYNRGTAVIKDGCTSVRLRAI